MDAIQRQLENQSRKCETLETELQTTLSALHESETRFQKEAAQRQQLQETLEFAQLNLQDRSQRSDLECSKLQTALQFEQAERKRQESQIVSIRHVSLDAARSARALRNTMRRQIREPVYSLCQSARSLLELELGEPQKKLAEAVLQDALLVHTSLQETDMPQGDSMESENTAE